MMCPLRTDDRGRFGRCEETRCAWWFAAENSDGDDVSSCAVAVSARPGILQSFGAMVGMGAALEDET